MPRTHHISTARLIQRRDPWLKKLGQLSPMTRGSLFCQEQPERGKARQFVWLTNFRLCRDNVQNTDLVAVDILNQPTPQSQYPNAPAQRRPRPKSAET